MQDLKALSLIEIETQAQNFGWPRFKAREIFSFIHQKLGIEVDKITALKKQERELLQKDFFISTPTIAKRQLGKQATKVLFCLNDGAMVEAVAMEYGKGQKTVCVSSQAGCPVGCLFCATGQNRFRRNLTAAEILSQVYYFVTPNQNAAIGGGVSNVVFMGMGEPFFNYDQVLAAAKILNHSLGQNIAARKIVISTVGIIDGIKKLAGEKQQFRLAWSLASPRDEIRRKLIPLGKLPRIAETLNALQFYQEKTGRRITIEYVVLKGVNDLEKDILELAQISKRIDCNVNLIPYNLIGRPPQKSLVVPAFLTGDILRAEAILQKHKVNVTIRKSLGTEIAAGCGQLAGERKGA